MICTILMQIIKAHAEKISKQGYRCLIPDLYHGNLSLEKEEAHHLFSNLDWPRAVAEVTQAVDHLKSEGCGKVAAIGFCMGGALAIAAAQHSDINGAVAFYGTPQKVLAQPENIKAPLQLHAGEMDAMREFSSPDAMNSWAEEVSKNGVEATCYVYEKCGHAFLNEGALAVELRNKMEFPEPPHEQQLKAWERVFEFFAKHLK